MIDATSGNWTVSKIAKILDEQKQSGFTVDVLVLDYDEYIQCEQKFKGENARQLEYNAIYLQLLHLAVDNDLILWFAAQTNRAGEGKKIITMKDIGEDIGKIKKVFLAIGIGQDPVNENVRWLHIIRHRGGRSRFAVEICTDFEAVQFYDRETTMKMRRMKRSTPVT